MVAARTGATYPTSPGSLDRRLSHNVEQEKGKADILEAALRRGTNESLARAVGRDQGLGCMSAMSVRKALPSLLDSMASPA